jgi:hypothetical protein
MPFPEPRHYDLATGTAFQEPKGHVLRLIRAQSDLVGPPGGPDALP